ncbi:hypothetical protein ALC57_03979 [Trachymyrmex cornetzi]|uniref:Transposable element Tc3 transposase n=1 Tax=Trachymyrmex cornetzi TaxID=471704 RepID=A0A151JLG6_9HYME|nr:hypothetical protein ALC57_03979 [Trachymyrmex cornetzi]
MSTRQIERELGIPKSTSHILTTHNFHPYHITLAQQLTFNDFQQRLEFCRWTNNPVSWCPRSPDLSSLDFSLWGYLKNVVYSKTPTTRENMMERITLACRSIPRNILLSTVDSFERRVQLCVDFNGQVFEHLLRS